MLHDIVHAILSAEPDIALEGAGASPNEIEDWIALKDADVAIVAGSEMASVDYESLLYAHPRLRLVVIAGDGRGAVVYQLHPTRTALGAFSPQVLVAAIRAKTMSGRTS
jgi:hypothetical protein